MTTNFAKIVDGAPTGDLSFEDPGIDGETWLEFDLDDVDNRAMKVVNGAIVEDASKKGFLVAEAAKSVSRGAAVSAAKVSGLGKLKALGLSDAESKILLGQAPTDDDLGI